jgi:transposase-like protein
VGSPKPQLITLVTSFGTPQDRWFVDETYVKVAGRWAYLYRAIDQFGPVIDVLMSEKRDLTATRRFFTRALEQAHAPAR